MVDSIYIGRGIEVPLDDIEFSAIRAQGAGGQNVNKVASAIHLRFDFENCSALDERIRARLRKLDDHRITANGIVIKAQEHRVQSRNREAAIARLQELLKSALVEPKKRIKTKPSRAAKKRRLDDKRRRANLKNSRSKISDDS